MLKLHIEEEAQAKVADELNLYKDKGTDYQIPTALKMNLKEFNGNGQLELKVEKLNLISKVDVLGELPFLLRKIIQLMVSKPFLFLYYQPSTLNLVSENGERSSHTGLLYSEISYL